MTTTFRSCFIETALLKVSNDPLEGITQCFAICLRSTAVFGHIILSLQFI